MDRRTVIGAGLAAAALSKQASADTVVQGDGMLPTDPKDVITLWPGTPPGGESLHLPPIRVTNHEPPYITPSDRAIDQVGIPVMNVFRPDRPDGSAMILAPGGGYLREMLDFEGMDVARHLNGAGVTCFVLRYRLPGEGWANRSDVPLQDAQRAMRLVRANAANMASIRRVSGSWGFPPAAMSPAPSPRVSPLGYMRRLMPPTAWMRGRTSPRPCIRSSPWARVATRARATICWAPIPRRKKSWPIPARRMCRPTRRRAGSCLAADDTTVPPIQNGVAYFAALRAANIPAAIHVFDAGGHGFGIARTAGKPDAVWPDLLLRWGAGHGFFKGAS